MRQSAEGVLEISGLPGDAPDPYASVIEIRLNGLTKKQYNAKEKMNTGSID
ncbi:hypothetical protein [Niabella hibiscisoli]|uniref:hypothetical protein n=1 Tax=Niabella hibiscisoli TaxID=1825928 RepID=UPI001F0E9E64|nr:hypothetical protein [Niabella hibiscisoli]MCH5719325.1 hypothetical protein [Niabella hibiscisoli]